MKASCLFCLALSHFFRCTSSWKGLWVARRQVLAAGTASVLGSGSICPSESIAAAPANPAEAVRRSAANIPGYGQTDVFYPETFSGSWSVSREILPSGVTLEYPIRFLRSIEEDSVVADRGWNQANLERAIRQISRKESESEASLPSYQWTETNPNDLRIKFADGKTKEIKVTKRATEKTDETVFSSEFQRVTQEDARGIPVITARRVITKWKVLDDSNIEGIEVVYDAGGSDPLIGSTSSSEQNKILSKSRIKLQRQQ
jgi:hypothetical protein